MFIPGPDRQETLLAELAAVEVHFPSAQAQMQRVQCRMESLDGAMKEAHQFQLHPSLDLSYDLYGVGNTTTCHGLGTTRRCTLIQTL